MRFIFILDWLSLVSLCFMQSIYLIGLILVRNYVLIYLDAGAPLQHFLPVEFDSCPVSLNLRSLCIIIRIFCFLSSRYGIHDGTYWCVCVWPPLWQALIGLVVRFKVGLSVQLLIYMVLSLTNFTIFFILVKTASRMLCCSLLFCFLAIYFGQSLYFCALVPNCCG